MKTPIMDDEDALNDEYRWRKSDEELPSSDGLFFVMYLGGCPGVLKFEKGRWRRTSDGVFLAYAPLAWMNIPNANFDIYNGTKE